MYGSRLPLSIAHGEGKLYTVCAPSRRWGSVGDRFFDLTSPVQLREHEQQGVGLGFRP